MLAWILEDAAYDPGFLIGGVPMNFGISARLSGSGKESSFFVIEADEYDTAFFDKRSKFVHYHAKTAILNNLEYDHADIFPDLQAIETQFHHLVRTVPGVGRVIANGREASLQRVLQRGCWSENEWFGGTDGWSLTTHEDGNFDVIFNGELQGTVNWALTGEHNRMNALAAIAAARHVGVLPAQAIAALGQFENVKRRMELRGTVNDIAVYDDFAHHPTAIATTLAGLRARVGNARILVGMEPRSNSMRLGSHADELAPSMRDADAVVFLKKNDLPWDAARVTAALDGRGSTAATVAELVDALRGIANPGDHVVFMSNGGFEAAPRRFFTALDAG
jgi:UDP-N-acetylmuramate: L-alanyl-gamma-D-glutamyl-meso-diaminopimelate ligase